jgi:hypothetical protein
MRVNQRWAPLAAHVQQQGSAHAGTQRFYGKPFERLTLATA